MHFLGCWQGEFVQQSRASLVDDHSLYSCDLNVWYRDGIVGRNLMLVIPRVQRVTWKVVVFVTGKDVKDLHQISPHHCLNKELLLRLQQGTCVSYTDTSWRRRLFLAHLLVFSFFFYFFFCVIPLWSVVFKWLHIERNYNYMLWLVITPLQTIGIKPSNFLRLSSACSF